MFWDYMIPFQIVIYVVWCCKNSHLNNKNPLQLFNVFDFNRMLFLVHIFIFFFVIQRIHSKLLIYIAFCMWHFCELIHVSFHKYTWMNVLNLVKSMYGTDVLQLTRSRLIFHSIWKLIRYWLCKTTTTTIKRFSTVSKGYFE